MKKSTVSFLKFVSYCIFCHMNIFLLFELCYTKYVLSRSMYMLKFAQFELEFLV